MHDWAGKMTLLKMEVMQWAEADFAADLDLNRICRELEIIRQRVIQAAPWCVCGCDSRTDCPTCENKRWISAGKYLTACIPTPTPLSKVCSINNPYSKKSSETKNTLLEE
jgi:hypothetical protein